MSDNTEQETGTFTLTFVERKRSGAERGAVVAEGFETWWEREIVPVLEYENPAVIALARNLAFRAWLGGAQSVLEVLK